MKTKPQSCHAKSRRVQAQAIETAKRRRVDGVRVLAAVNAMIPKSQDVDGRARGALAVLDVASSAQVSGKAVARALRHWQSWRVFWLWWKGKRNWEVRFERRVVEELLSTPQHAIGAFLLAHKRRREAESERNSGQQIVVQYHGGGKFSLMALGKP
jgi:hypothetical protein